MLGMDHLTSSSPRLYAVGAIIYNCEPEEQKTGVTTLPKFLQPVSIEGSMNPAVPT